jgi:hypothetical protein
MMDADEEQSLARLWDSKIGGVEKLSAYEVFTCET